MKTIICSLAFVALIFAGLNHRQNRIEDFKAGIWTLKYHHTNGSLTDAELERDMNELFMNAKKEFIFKSDLVD